MRNLNPADLSDLLLAHEAEELTEGQVMRATGLDRVSIRLLREEAIARGKRLAVTRALPEKPSTSDATSPALETTTDPQS